MGKKRKHTETLDAAAAEAAKKNDFASERPKRTLTGWKNKPQEENVEEKENGEHFFRNKEKVLITCSRRINFRFSIISSIGLCFVCFPNLWTLIIFSWKLIHCGILF